MNLIETTNHKPKMYTSKLERNTGILLKKMIKPRWKKKEEEKEKKKLKIKKSKKKKKKKERRKKPRGTKKKKEVKRK